MIFVQGSTHLVTPDIADEFLMLSRRQVFLEAARDAGQHGYHAVDVDGWVCHSLQHVLFIWRKGQGKQGVISGGRAWPGEKISFSSACLFWGQNGKGFRAKFIFVRYFTAWMSVGFASSYQVIHVSYFVPWIEEDFALWCPCLFFPTEGFALCCLCPFFSAEGFALCYHCPLFHGLNAWGLCIKIILVSYSAPWRGFCVMLSLSSFSTRVPDTLEHRDSFSQEYLTP